MVLVTCPRSYSWWVGVEPGFELGWSFSNNWLVNQCVLLPPNNSNENSNNSFIYWAPRKHFVHIVASDLYDNLPGGSLSLCVTDEETEAQREKTRCPAPWTSKRWSPDWTPGQTVNPWLPGFRRWSNSHFPSQSCCISCCSGSREENLLKPASYLWWGLVSSRSNSTQPHCPEPGWMAHLYISGDAEWGIGVGIGGRRGGGRAR